MGASTRSDRGQATVLLIVVIVITTLAAIGVADLGGRLVDHGRARTAADAAALAATTGGLEAARRLAASNGGRLVAYREVGDVVEVTVEVGGVVVTARATDGP